MTKTSPHPPYPMFINPASTSIGVVGVGRMGANMARRLADCGYPIGAVYDVATDSAMSLAEELQTTAAPNLVSVTTVCDVIITVVSDDVAMKAIYTNPGDHLLMGSAGKLFINCATITPKVHCDVMALATDSGAFMLECPMASSITQAREGTLYLMCAGNEAVYHEALPVLNHLSASTVYTGEAGTASSLKALVNMVMNMNTAALAEGLGLADALGLDLDVVKQVFAQTGANSRVLQTDGDDMQYRDHAVYFSSAHAAKDSGIALELGKQAGLTLPVAQATLAQYQRLVSLGLGELDKSAVAELTFRDRHGT
ncbi:MAG: NAD(P)-dependent oxidoreductase [Vampirovibrionales bacterium]|nr:NAD(P)-dependent oxidoreductase [Vampirovibrionales bacterium]